MTSPCLSLTNFGGIIRLPSNPKHKLKISVPGCDKDYWQNKCNVRKISLITENAQKTYIDDYELTPFSIFSYLGDFNDEKIIKEFREDEINFI